MAPVVVEVDQICRKRPRGKMNEKEFSNGLNDYKTGSRGLECHSKWKVPIKEEASHYYQMHKKQRIIPGSGLKCHLK